MHTAESLSEPQQNIERMHAANNFDFLRFAAASLVLFSHSYALSGNSVSEPLLRLTGYESGGGLAVSIFFVISGYLVTASFLRSRCWRDFLIKRSLRLMPGLTAAVLFAVFVVGPLSTTLPLGEYFSATGTWLHLSNAIFVIRHALPGVFEQNPFPVAVNGSLWTLPVEAVMYLLLLCGGTAGLLTRGVVTGITCCWLAGTILADQTTALAFLPLPRQHQVYFLLKLGAYFFSGASLYLWREKVPLHAGIAGACLAATILTFKSGLGPFCLQIALPYLIIYAACSPLPVLRDFGRFGDFSYGIYLFAFPVQQLVISRWQGQVDLVAYMAVSFCLTFVLAVISWKLIESPALRLKRRFS